ncbi:MAG: succinate dehydrogenase, hydrophobic membrane anchor protein [Alphaproteobacteria bacterium]|jgi:succinate dehydrogenase / fumarate reductase membrane anchor subunit
MTHKQDLNTPLARARGLGSAKDGLHHWWLQRLSAIILIPLSIWLMVAVMGGLMDANRVEVSAWLEHPLVAIAMLGLLGAGLLHARLGVQTVLEDYIHHEALKMALVVMNTLLFLTVAVCGIFAVIKLHFFGI